MGSTFITTVREMYSGILKCALHQYLARPDWSSSKNDNYIFKLCGLVGKDIKPRVEGLKS